jgi:hypothetical protein
LPAKIVKKEKSYNGERGSDGGREGEMRCGGDEVKGDKETK